MVKHENGNGGAAGAVDMDEDVAGALSQSQTEVIAWGELVSLNRSEHEDFQMSQNTVIFGRRNTCQLKFQDPRISTIHAKLERIEDGPTDGGVAVLHDLSSNGTFVNGEKIGSGNSKTIKDGDMISLIVVPVKGADGSWSHTDETIKKIFVAYIFKFLGASQVSSQPPRAIGQSSQPSLTVAASAALSSLEEVDARVESEQAELNKLVATLEKKKNREHFDKDFEQSTLLGEGGFAKVFIAKHRDTDMEVAVKVIDVEKWKLNRGTLRPSQIEDEVSIHRELKHPNVVRLLWCYTSRRYFHIVLEKVNGGDLFDYLVNGGKGLEEGLSRRWFTQLLKGVEYMHDNGIVHRDLKPENILLDRNDESATLKISDFGLAKITAGSQACQTRCGTINYMAPEVAAVDGEKVYGKEADMWGLGVILHVMASLTMPFEGDEEKTEKDLINMAKNGKMSLQTLLKGDVWKDKSATLKALLRHLLTPDIKKRATMADALGSPWVEGADLTSPAKRKEEAEDGGSGRKKGRRG